MASRSYTQSSSWAGTSKAKSIACPPGASPEYMSQVLGIKKVKSSTSVSSQPTKKRKAPQLSQDDDEDGYNDEEDELAARARQDALAGIENSKPKKARKKKDEEPEEKRLKRFRAKPPVSYLERLSRAKQQRMFLIDRNRTTSSDGTYEEEVFDIAGTTGNVYQVTVSKVPSCTCPDANKGNQCKHIVYVCTLYSSLAQQYSWAI